MLTETERRWLDYAWEVVNCPTGHRRACERAGGARPGQGRVDGNELRWPGYLGRRYGEERGVLCVGAVHREATPELERRDRTIGRTNAELATSAREWLAGGRSEPGDSRYLGRVRSAYEEALPQWARWQRHYRTLVEDYLGMSSTQIAWSNLAKCRVSIDRGPKQRSAEAALTRLCQSAFPIDRLIEAIRPVVVLVAVLNAKAGGGIVSSWESASCSPIVYTWQGQSGHDRHNTAPGARPLREWAPEMARRVKASFGSAIPRSERP